MRFLIGLLFVFASLELASAVDFRWTRGFAQGTVESIIQNANGSSVNIFCPSGQPDKTPGMFITATTVKAKPGETYTVQIIVDGNNYPFYFADNGFQPGTRIDRGDFNALVKALATSKSKQFVVEFPKFNWSETFSLLDARKSLGSGKQSVLWGCA